MEYDVFISFKRSALDGSGPTRDYYFASDLHRTLQSNGIKSFLSEKDLSTSDFANQIYNALEEAKILIVVGTRREYMEFEWVQSEWSKFQNAMLSGRKPNGEIITYLEGINENQVPFALSDMQSFQSKGRISALG